MESPMIAEILRYESETGIFQNVEKDVTLLMKFMCSRKELNQAFSLLLDECLPSIKEDGLKKGENALAHNLKFELVRQLHSSSFIENYMGINNFLKSLFHLDKHISSTLTNLKIPFLKHVQYRKLPAPSLAANKEFLGASKKVKVVYSTERGDHVLCDKPILKGDFLFVEKPMVWCIDLQYKHLFCAYCCVRLIIHETRTFECCSLCSEVAYCSCRCKEDAWSYHRFECGYIKMLQAMPFGHLTLRAFLLSPRLKDGQDYAPFDLYCSMDHMPTEFVFLRALEALFLIHFLRETSNYFEKDTPVELETRAAAHMLRILLQMRFCSVDLLHSYLNMVLQHQEVGFSDQPSLIVIGAAVYPAVSKLNHSCLPNLHIWFSGNSIVSVATKNIATGEEICMSYGHNLLSDNTEKRRRMLKERYYFECNCNICTSPVELAYVYKALRCPACAGPLIPCFNDDVKEGICFNCETQSPIYHRSLEVSDKIMAIVRKDAKRGSGEIPLMFLISAWRTARKVLYHTHYALTALACRIQLALSNAGAYEMALTVGLACVPALRLNVSKEDAACKLNTLVLLAERITQSYPAGHFKIRKFQKDKQNLEKEWKAKMMEVFGRLEISTEFEII